MRPYFVLLSELRDVDVVSGEQPELGRMEERMLARLLDGADAAARARAVTAPPAPRRAPCLPLARGKAARRFSARIAPIRLGRR